MPRIIFLQTLLFPSHIVEVLKTFVTLQQCFIILLTTVHTDHLTTINDLDT